MVRWRKREEGGLCGEMEEEERLCGEMEEEGGCVVR